MADERPQFYENILTPLTINTHSLTESLQELRVAVRNGAQSVHKDDPIPEKWNVGGMFKHFPGMGITYIYPDLQISKLDLLPLGQCGEHLL